MQGKKKLFHKGKLRALYREDGHELPEEDVVQPTTPLKLCVFRFSDCLLSNEQRLSLLSIAGLLIEHGADKESALQYYEDRYGIHEGKDASEGDGVQDPFMALFRLLQG
mmetsp:Transcript_44487/g.69571  ORF Transcript_44487/g.69571 Transcript_44487/m.69571 type:complete len:109 (+) Transcript_44487:252-578(+)